MREIKFRYVEKHKKTGEIKLVYSTLADVEAEDSWQGPRSWETIAIDLFTGVHDMNGDPIYENDIVIHERSISSGDDYFTGEPVDDDKTITRTGKISITPSKGVCINGKAKTVNDITGDIENGRYHGNPGSYGVYSEYIGNVYHNPGLL